jgi:hypothetical protein
MCACSRPLRWLVGKVVIASDCRNMVTSLEQGSMESYAHIVQKIGDTRRDFERCSVMKAGRRIKRRIA